MNVNWELVEGVVDVAAVVLVTFTTVGWIVAGLL